MLRNPLMRVDSRVVLLAAALLLRPTVLEAAGEETFRQAADLVLTIDSRWAGCGQGGYYPVRIKAANRGLDCEVTFQFKQQGPQPVPTVQQRVRLAQNSTARVTLLIPCVGDGAFGSLEVFRNGRFIKDLSSSLSIPESDRYGLPRPALLIISPTIREDAGAFESAVTSIQNTSGTSPRYGHYGAIAYENHQLVGTELLPENWLGYSGLDLVAIALNTLEGLPEQERAAIIKWTRSGGTLIVYDVGAAPAESPKLHQILGLPSETAQAANWTPAQLATRAPIALVETDEFGNVVQLEIDEATMEATMSAAEITGSGAGNESSGQEHLGVGTFAWPGDETVFAGRPLMMGHVAAFRENPFTGTPHDWAWFLNSLPAARRTWTARHGFASRQGTDEFLTCLIASVKGVPVLSFLLLITLFTIAIGPLNYLWLWKKRRLYLLILTIPAIALATSLSLLGYAVVAHGFSTKARVRSLTWLDQNANAAVSINRVSLYSGLAPSQGLQFSPDTAVYPIWPENNEFQSGSVDWTDTQQLRGWLKSRTRTQFLTVNPRDERGRLRISPQVDQSGRKLLHVENGLEWPLTALIVADDDGQWFFAEELPTGAAADLLPCTREQREEFARLLEQFPLTPPAASTRSGNFFDWAVDPYYLYGGGPALRYSDSLQETWLSRLEQAARTGGRIEPRSYAAIISQNPGLESGVEHAYEEDSIHVLGGNY